MSNLTQSFDEQLTEILFRAAGGISDMGQEEKAAIHKAVIQLVRKVKWQQLKKGDMSDHYTGSRKSWNAATEAYEAALLKALGGNDE